MKTEIESRVAAFAMSLVLAVVTTVGVGVSMTTNGDRVWSAASAQTAVARATSVAPVASVAPAAGVATIAARAPVTTATVAATTTPAMAAPVMSELKAPAATTSRHVM
jgi:hypothetical protein